jgi:hypothetical protein
VLRLKLKNHSAEAGGVVVGPVGIPRLKLNTMQLKLVVSLIFFTASCVGGIIFRTSSGAANNGCMMGFTQDGYDHDPQHCCTGGW